MFNSNRQNRASTGSLQLPASKGSGKKPHIDTFQSTFQKLFKQAKPPARSNARTNSFGFNFADSSIRLLLKENKPNVFDLRGTKSKLSFDFNDKNCELRQQMRKPNPRQRFSSSQPQLDVIPSDKSRSPNASRQIPTCKLQRKLFAQNSQKQLQSKMQTQEQNVTLKIPNYSADMIRKHDTVSIQKEKTKDVERKASKVKLVTKIKALEVR